MEMNDIYRNLHEEIKKYLIDSRNMVNSNWRILYTKNPVIKDLIDRINGLENLLDLNLSERIYCIRNDIFSPPLCQGKDCTKRVNFYRSNKGFNKFCSPDCKKKNVIISDEQKEKQRIAMTGKPSWSKGKTKYSDPRLAKQAENLSKAKKGKTPSPKQLEHLKEISENNKGRVMTEEAKNKFKKTCLEKYGVVSVLALPENREKIRILKYKKVLSSPILRKFVTPLFNFEEFKGTEVKNENYEWKCVFCGNEFIDHICNKRIPRCLKCFPKTNGTSAYEEELYNWILSLNLNGNIIKGSRNIISPHQIDIYCKEYSLAIEFNGLYWHSDFYRKKECHYDKWNKCNKKGIHLLQIFEDEWITRKDLVKSIILGKLNIYVSTIFERLCIVKEISFNECNTFLEENHLQGEVCGSKYLGLFFKEELVSLMVTGIPYFNKQYEYEIIRFCNKKHTKIIGGFQKLLHYFIEKYSPSSIISYCDLRFFNGGVYQKSGFVFSHLSKPNYFYFKQNHQKFNRINFQKHKLKDILPEYNEELSEEQNMFLNGYLRIWDCGQKVFVYNSSKGGE